MNSMKEKKLFALCPQILMTVKRIFLANLKPQLPEECTYGKRLMIGGSIFFSQEEGNSTQVAQEIQKFIVTYTNATALQQTHPDINGLELVSKCILNYTQILLDETNARQPDSAKNNYVVIQIDIFNFICQRLVVHPSTQFINKIHIESKGPDIQV